jgi:hypothetical protein
VTIVSIDVDPIDIDWLHGAARLLGGAGSGFYGHAGRRGEIGGSSRADVGPPPVEAAKQAALAATQTNPLAKPIVVFGFEPTATGMNQHYGKQYVAAYGEEFKAQPLPEDVRKGVPNECYKNASLLIMERDDLTYAEGFASKEPGGLAVLHAWAVDSDGNVIDPTLPDPEAWYYFGVKYDRKKYMKSLFKQKLYGVLGSTTQFAAKAIATGGAALR